MIADQLMVVAEYPSARCVFHTDMRLHKVYRMIGQCRVALSRACESASEAWADAAAAVREKQVVKLET